MSAQASRSALPSANRYSSEAARWKAVVTRDKDADNAFVYCVRTTKIYCRPICKARLARRSNVEFYADAATAESAGYRPCKRCRPQLEAYDPAREVVAQACRTIESWDWDGKDGDGSGGKGPSLEFLANQAKLTRSHFHRVFKSVTGLSPRAYALKSRGQKVPDVDEEQSSPASTPREQHMDQDSTEAASASHLVQRWDAEDEERLARQLQGLPVHMDSGIVTPLTSITYTITSTTFGFILIAFNTRGVCALQMGDSGEELYDELQSRFPSPYNACIKLEEAQDMESNEEQQRVTRWRQEQVDAILEALERPSGKTLNLGLDPEILF